MCKSFSTSNSRKEPDTISSLSFCDHHNIRHDNSNSVGCHGLLYTPCMCICSHSTASIEKHTFHRKQSSKRIQLGIFLHKTHLSTHSRWRIQYNPSLCHQCKSYIQEYTWRKPKGTSVYKSHLGIHKGIG